MFHKFDVRDDQDSSFAICRTKKTISRWNSDENHRYAEFLKNREYADDKCKFSKKNRGMYLEMAQTIGTRNNLQCRTHHIKMLKTHSTEENIIQYFLKNQTNACEKSHQTQKNEGTVDNGLGFEIFEEDSFSNRPQIFMEVQMQMIQLPQDGLNREESYFEPFFPPQFY